MSSLKILELQSWLTQTFWAHNWNSEMSHFISWVANSMLERNLTFYEFVKKIEMRDGPLWFLGAQLKMRQYIWPTMTQTGATVGLVPTLFINVVVPATHTFEFMLQLQNLSHCGGKPPHPLICEGKPPHPHQWPWSTTEANSVGTDSIVELKTNRFEELCMCTQFYTGN